MLSFSEYYTLCLKSSSNAVMQRKWKCKANSANGNIFFTMNKKVNENFIIKLKTFTA
jgi:hypothetical protein